MESTGLRVKPSLLRLGWLLYAHREGQIGLFSRCLVIILAHYYDQRQKPKYRECSFLFLEYSLHQHIICSSARTLTAWQPASAPSPALVASAYIDSQVFLTVGSSVELRESYLIDADVLKPLLYHSHKVISISLLDETPPKTKKGGIRKRRKRPHIRGQRRIGTDACELPSFNLCEE